MIQWWDLFNPAILLLLALGLYLVFAKPLLKLGATRTLELGLATICALIFLFHFSSVVLVPLFEASTAQESPCDLTGRLGRCYTINHENCQKGWDHFASVCQKQVRDSLSEKQLSALVGGTVLQCTQKKWDRAFKATRKTPVDDPFCQEYFSTLDQPSLENF